MSKKLHLHAARMGLVEPSFADLEVSQEGLVGDMVGWVRDLFKYRPADHNKLVDKALGHARQEIESHRKLRKLLTKCFLDERWLQSQEFIEGEISSTFIAPSLCFGEGVLKDPYRSLFVNPDQVTNQIMQVADAAAKNVDFVHRRYNDLLKECSGGISMVRMAIDERVRKAKAEAEVAESSGGHATTRRSTTTVGDIVMTDVLPALMIKNKVERAVLELTRSSTAQHLSPAHFWDAWRPNLQLYRGRRETGGYKSRTVRTSQVTDFAPLPALTREQIRTLAQQITRWLDNGFLNHPLHMITGAVTNRSAFGWRWNDMSTDAWEPGDNDSSTSDEEIFWYIVGSTPHGRALRESIENAKDLNHWINGSELFYTLQFPAVAAIHWMANSIKGRLPSMS